MQKAAREIDALKTKIADLRTEKMSEKEMKAFSLSKIFEKTSTGNRSISSKVRCSQRNSCVHTRDFIFVIIIMFQIDFLRVLSFPRVVCG